MKKLNENELALALGYYFECRTAGAVADAAFDKAWNDILSTGTSAVEIPTKEYLNRRMLAGTGDSALYDLLVNGQTIKEQELPDGCPDDTKVTFFSTEQIWRNRRDHHSVEHINIYVYFREEYDDDGDLVLYEELGFGLEIR